MANKKYVVGAESVTEVVYLNMNVCATGGKKERLVFVDDDARADIVNHKRNYGQRRKVRRETVKELIVNNFTPGQSSMITLTFAPKEACKDSPSMEGDLDNLLSAVDLGSYRATDEDGIFYERQEEEKHSTPEIDDADIFINVPDISQIKERDNCDIFVEGDMEEPDDAFWNAVQIPTPEDKYQDLKVCNREFKKFIQRMNYRYENFRYVAVMTRQRNQRWHYHMFCNLPFVDYKSLLDVWKNGGVFVSVTDGENFEIKWKYMIQNMSKDKAPDLAGEKGYLSSRGLKRNVVFRSWKWDEAEQCREIGVYLKAHGHGELEYTSKSPAHEGECKYYKYDVALPKAFTNNGEAAPRQQEVPI